MHSIELLTARQMRRLFFGVALVALLYFVRRMWRKQRKLAVSLLDTLSSLEIDSSTKLEAMRELAKQLKDPHLTPEGLDVQTFASLADDIVVPLIDVRSPGEFQRGHIAGAHNIPLFTNEQRAEVGTLYKQEGREVAMEIAIQMVAPKLPHLVSQVKSLCTEASKTSPGQPPKVAVHCWRGGMRSGSVAFMLRQHGFNVSILSGGYKAYRTWVVECWDRPNWLPDVLPNPSSETQAAAHDSPHSTHNQNCRDAADQTQETGSPQKTGPPQENGLGKKARNRLWRKQRNEQRKDEKILKRLAAEASVTTRKHQELRPLQPPATQPEEWSNLDPVEAMSRLRICVVAGRTGVGKTKILHALTALGHSVVDLEGLAAHRGSTFGWCGQGDAQCGYQPSDEHYSNLVASAWRQAAMTPMPHAIGRDVRKYRWVFIEDEGIMVGKCKVPPSLFTMLRCAPLVVRVSVPVEARIKLLVEEYSGAQAQGDDPATWLEDMQTSVRRLGRKLGPERVTQLQGFLERGEFESVVRNLLQHYDHLYDYHATNGDSAGSKSKSARRHYIVDVEQTQGDDIDASTLAQSIIEHVDQFEAQEL